MSLISLTQENVTKSVAFLEQWGSVDGVVKYFKEGDKLQTELREIEEPIGCWRNRVFYFTLVATSIICIGLLYKVNKVFLKHRLLSAAASVVLIGWISFRFSLPISIRNFSQKVSQYLVKGSNSDKVEEIKEHLEQRGTNIFLYEEVLLAGYYAKVDFVVSFFNMMKIYTPERQKFPQRWEEEKAKEFLEYIITNYGPKEKDKLFRNERLQSLVAFNDYSFHQQLLEPAKALIAWKMEDLTQVGLNSQSLLCVGQVRRLAQYFVRGHATEDPDLPYVDLQKTTEGYYEAQAWPLKI